MDLARYIDHTFLKPTATPEDIKKLCSQAMEFNFYAVCVNSSYVSLANKELQSSTVKLASVIGFPLGAMATAAKIFETGLCLDHGADEIDMVINIGWLKAGLHKEVEQEIRQIKQCLESKTLKVIIETCYLTKNEKSAACRLVEAAGADFIKTSTGFGTGGATFEDVRLMKEILGDRVKIKASGGIKDQATARQFVLLGAQRLGTSSGITLVSEK